MRKPERRENDGIYDILEAAIQLQKLIRVHRPSEIFFSRAYDMLSRAIGAEKERRGIPQDQLRDFARLQHEATWDEDDDARMLRDYLDPFGKDYELADPPEKRATEKELR
jgi:hypothetical protein